MAEGSVGKQDVDVSVVIPVFNAGKWLDACLQSVCEQSFQGSLQVCLYLDSCTDNSKQILTNWIPQFTERGIECVFKEGAGGSPQGVGYAKNRAVAISRGRYLCFLDSDDVMHCERISHQYQAASLPSNDNAIIGCQFNREPEGSTERYTNWANRLTHTQLLTQIYTSHGPTVIMPTWFCARKIFDQVGGFDETGKGTPEDLIFFFAHIHSGGTVFRVDKTLLMYRYHEEAATFSVLEDTIWHIRIQAFQRHVLSQWDSFTIWNAGKQGRRFYRSLSPDNRRKCSAFCDVDAKKIAKGEYVYEESREKVKPRVPVVHFSQAAVPVVVCVKLNLTGGGFEANLAAMNWTEGKDFYFFS